jgi:Fur family zinc uptake transcriptional regulator
VPEKPERAFPPPQHDHDDCRRDLLQRAEEVFASRRLRLTGLRRRVLEEIAASHHALGAYDILARLAGDGNPRLAPISIYRALEALMDVGLVHRLESRNAYFACSGGHEERRRRLVLACQQCGRVAEVEAEQVFAAIDATSRAASFVRGSSLVEVSGTCDHCAELGGQASA